MSLTPAQQTLVAACRRRFTARLADDARFGSPEPHDRPDGTSLALRFPVATGLALELAVRPLVPQLRVGLLTEDRWLNEDLEQAIEDSGDSMSEFVELGFEEAGLSWPDPPVEHYREQGRWFYFATAWEPCSLVELASDAALDRAAAMFAGYHEAFRAVIQRAGGLPAAP